MNSARFRKLSRHGRKVATLVAVLLVLSAPQAQAQSGFFRVHCGLSHEAQMDPIVAPGQVSEHLHDFFGNDTTTSTSTYASMIGQSSSCDVTGDSAAYWAPTLVDRSGTPIPVARMTVYYRDEPDLNAPVTPFPPDFRMIAGYPAPHLQDGPIKKGGYGWNCDNTEPLLNTANIDCAGHPGDGYVKANIFFPNCGQLSGGKIVTDSPDHRSHVAYPVNGVCPANYPVKLPTIYYKIKYQLTNCIAAGCHLVSDAMEGTTLGQSLHADFWNTWAQPTLDAMVSSCLNGNSC